MWCLPSSSATCTQRSRCSQRPSSTAESIAFGRSLPQYHLRSPPPQISPQLLSPGLTVKLCMRISEFWLIESTYVVSNTKGINRRGFGFEWRLSMLDILLFCRFRHCRMWYCIAQIPSLQLIARPQGFGATQHRMALLLDSRAPVDPYSIKRRHSVSRITFDLLFVWESPLHFGAACLEPSTVPSFF